MKILVINGPNINMLGIREPEIYGKKDYAALVKYIEETGEALGMETEIYQSNIEGEIIDKIQAAYKKADGIVINPGGYTHTSVAIGDALKAVAIPSVEVHLSDVNSREDFRKISYIKDVCIKTYSGLGFESYGLALKHLKDFLSA